MVQTLSKSKFKPRALEYFRKVQETGEELVLTDHGKPVLKITAFKPDPDAALKSLRKTVVRFTDPLRPAAADWEALR